MPHPRSAPVIYLQTPPSIVASWLLPRLRPRQAHDYISTAVLAFLEREQPARSSLRSDSASPGRVTRPGEATSLYRVPSCNPYLCILILNIPRLNWIQCSLESRCHSGGEPAARTWQLKMILVPLVVFNLIQFQPRCIKSNDFSQCRARDRGHYVIYCVHLR